MRILVLSDIHANLEALNAVLAAIPACNAVWNLGDVVGYGANPNEVIAHVQGLNALSVRGNHDKVCAGIESAEGFNPIAARAAHWTRDALSCEHAEWLRGLPSGPLLPAGYDASCSHGSPLDEDQYLVTTRDAQLPLTQTATRINFFGHTHVQGGFATNGDEWFRLTPQYHARGADEFELPLRKNVRYLINPGSVGQPRDGDWRAAFAVYEIEDTNGAQRVLFHRAPYGIKQAQAAIRAAGLPDRLATRLKEGR